MKDEIKEIELDHFNSIKELKQNVETWIKEDDMYWERWFSLYDLKLLLDYITNLQEELKYQKQAEQEYNEKHTKLMKKYKELQERKDKAIEYIKQYKELDFSDLDLLSILKRK